MVLSLLQNKIKKPANPFAPVSNIPSASSPPNAGMFAPVKSLQETIQGKMTPAPDNPFGDGGGSPVGDPSGDYGDSSYGGYIPGIGRVTKGYLNKRAARNARNTGGGGAGGGGGGASGGGGGAMSPGGGVTRSVSASGLTPLGSQLAEMKQQAVQEALNPSGGSAPSTETAGTMASSDAAQKYYDTYAGRLAKTYEDANKNLFNEINRRNLQGSGIQNMMLGESQSNFAQALSDLAGNIAGQEAGWNAQNIQGQVAQANLGLKQQQINNQKLNSLLSLFS